MNNSIEGNASNIHMNSVMSLGMPVDDHYILWDREEVKRHFYWKSDSALYQAIRIYQFPLPIRVGGRRVVWRLSDIKKWIDSRPQGLDVGKD